MEQLRTPASVPEEKQGMPQLVDDGCVEGTPLCVLVSEGSRQETGLCSCLALRVGYPLFGWWVAHGLVGDGVWCGWVGVA